MPENRHPVKLVKTFIKLVKHTVTDEHFPFDNISRFFTISAMIQIKKWNSVKNNPVERNEFIENFKDIDNECKENDFLKNPRGENEEDV